ncbi:MAG: hydrogenase nickel incorporation protein HypB [Pseudomonadota bacterium]
MEILIKQDLLIANEEKAKDIRARLKQHNICMLNLIGSPGAGKTSLLEKTFSTLGQRCRMAVIEGDVETDEDAKRLAQYPVLIAMVNTHGACHLESVSVEKALNAFDLKKLDLIFVENIGNLVCPAEFDVGENLKIAVLSVCEGDDKVIKYPLLFREASIVVLHKIDLLPYLNFNRARFYADLKKVNPKAKVLEVSCTTEEGVDAWCKMILSFTKINVISIS